MVDDSERSAFERGQRQFRRSSGAKATREVGVLAFVAVWCAAAVLLVRVLGVTVGGLAAVILLVVAYVIAKSARTD